MSIILFWSPFHGQGQTSNLHVFALAVNCLYGKSTLLMQNHFDKNNLESPLIGQNVDKQTGYDNPLFQNIGLDMAVNDSNMHKLTANMMESCCISFRNTSILLLPGTETKNRDSFNQNIGKAVSRMIKKAGEYVDIVLVDANSGEDELSFKLMSLADMIIINLTQRRYVLDKFFAEYGEFFRTKPVFYLLGNYDDSSSYNISNCRRKYKKYMNRFNSGVIPYSTKYLDAQNESSVISFLQTGFNRKDQYGSKKLLWLLKHKLHTAKYVNEETEFFFSRARMSIEALLKLLINKENDEYGEVKPL